jgi:hypothetical protein
MQILSEAFPVAKDNKGVIPDNVKLFIPRIHSKSDLALLRDSFGRAWSKGSKCFLIVHILNFLSEETFDHCTSKRENNVQRGHELYAQSSSVRYFLAPSARNAQYPAIVPLHFFVLASRLRCISGIQLFFFSYPHI